jgi:hypothetical protein
MGDRRGRDRMVVGFTTTYAFSTYRRNSYESYTGLRLIKTTNTGLRLSILRWFMVYGV